MATMTETRTKTTIHESLMHCAKCGGNQWYFSEGLARCATCTPPEGEVEIIPCTWTWPRHERRPQFKLPKEIADQIPGDFILRAILACDKYELTTARTLKREIREDIAKNPAEGVRKWRAFTENTLEATK